MPPVYDVPSRTWHFLDEIHLKSHILYLVMACSLGKQLILKHIKPINPGSHNSFVSTVFTVNTQQPSLFGAGISADYEEDPNEDSDCIAGRSIVLRREDVFDSYSLFLLQWPFFFF